MHVQFNIRKFLSTGGYSNFAAKFPHHCVESTDASSSSDEDDEASSPLMGLKNLTVRDIIADDVTPDNACEFPVEILPFLFLGNAKNSSDIEVLHKHNIKYILNVTPNVPNVFENDGQITYMQIPISDHWSQNLSLHFPESIAFIGE